MKRAILTWRRALLGLGAFIALALAAGARCDKDPTELEGRYATPPSKFVDVDGARVHYRDRGTGEPAILLVHGSNSSLFTWEGWASTLATNHRVVSLDMPGHGLTGPDPHGRYSAAERLASSSSDHEHPPTALIDHLRISCTVAPRAASGSSSVRATVNEPHS